MVSHQFIRDTFSRFWETAPRNHILIPPIPLIPDDQTTLFTSAGMQPLIPYLIGKIHPLGKRLYNIQPCFRSQDIEEVGDNRHTTFFEMLGNWSLGDYYKKEQLEWVYGLFTKELGLPQEKLCVSVFEGNRDVPKDVESATIWKKLGIPENRIRYYGVGQNWWSRSSTPDQMPVGEIGGPDTEIFYDFGERHSCGKDCHPNCQCGRFLEIGNSVFIEYRKNTNGKLEPLSQKSIDFGAGLERLLAALTGTPDIFTTELFFPIIQSLERHSGKKYEDRESSHGMRIIADHMKAAVFMASQGVKPGSKKQESVMRRLIRRSVVKLVELAIPPEKIVPILCQEIFNMYKSVYFQNNHSYGIDLVIGNEVKAFLKTLHESTKLLQKETITGEFLFNLQQTYGFPYEIAVEQLEKWDRQFDRIKTAKEYKDAFKKHQEKSRLSSAQMFKGGLADKNEQTLRYHTATHLLHQALLDVLGQEVRQEGSNITGERLRFDFYSTKKPSEAEIKKIESIVNEKINEGLPVSYEEKPLSDALKIGARATFKQKYPEVVKVYSIGNYSKELCGGPHVENTKDIGSISIYEWEKIAANTYRIYAR